MSLIYGILTQSKPTFDRAPSVILYQIPALTYVNRPLLLALPKLPQKQKALVTALIRQDGSIAKFDNRLLDQNARKDTLKSEACRAYLNLLELGFNIDNLLAFQCLEKHSHQPKATLGTITYSPAQLREIIGPPSNWFNYISPTKYQLIALAFGLNQSLELFTYQDLSSTFKLSITSISANIIKARAFLASRGILFRTKQISEESKIGRLSSLLNL